MTAFSDEIALKLRDYVTDGVPSSGAYTPDIADIRSLFTSLALVTYTISSVQDFVLAASTAAALTAIGLGTGNSPTFTGLTLTGSATIAGDLTVDTTTLKVDSTNNRVGVLTTTPAYALDVNGTISGTTIYATQILRPTSDGSDNSTVTLSGGGAVELSSRGAWITLNGNEAAGAGTLSIIAGDIAAASVDIRGPGRTSGTYNGLVGVSGGGGGTGDATSARVVAYGGAHASLAGHLFLQSGSTGNVFICPQTTDGTDNRVVYLNGGGATGSGTTSRGARVDLYGNEVSSVGGSLYLFGGDVTTASVDIRGGGASTANSVTISGGSGSSDTTSARILAYGGTNGQTGSLYLNSGSGGSIFLYPNTSDGTDNKSVQIWGGNNNTTARGALFLLYGNEGSGTGQITMYGGDIADAGLRLYGAGTTDLNYRGSHQIYGGISTATGAYVQIYGNAHASNAGRLVLSSGSAGDVYVQTGTSDGSDSKSAFLAGGGSNAATRGGWIQVYGNEHGSFPGEVVISSGLAGNISIAPGTSDTADNRYVRISGGGGYAGTRGAGLTLYGNENGSAGNAFLNSGDTGNVILFTGTASSTDNRYILITASGSAGADATRGANIFVYGINHANTGRIVITPASGAYIGMGGITKPTADNTLTLGDASFRWSVVYAGTGTINTSDASEKDWRGGFDEVEMRIAERLADAVGVFQWKDAVAQKGTSGARFHVGPTAQALHAAFAAEGRDAGRYAMWCLDPVIREDGTSFVRQGVRSDQVSLFLAAAGLRKIEAHNTRIAAMEAAMAINDNRITDLEQRVAVLEAA